MSELSYWWTAPGSTGDQVASYTQAHLATIAKVLAAGSGYQGVAPGLGNELAVSTPGGLVSRVASGGAVVDGKPYYNDSNLDLTHDATPSTRRDYLVLDCNWSAFNVSAAIVKGTDGTTNLPSLTNTPGTRVQLALAEVTVSSGGTVSHVDVRPFAAGGANSLLANAVTTAKIADDAVTGDKIAPDSVLSGHIAANEVIDSRLRDSAALSVIGRAANSTGDPADIAAGTDGYVLRRAGTALGFGQVATAGIANDAIDDTKVGNRVPQFYRRQGGDPASWYVSGTTNYTPGAVRMLSGSAVVSMTGSSGSVAITFPVAFSQPPIVVGLVAEDEGEPTITPTLAFANLTATGFTILVTNVAAYGGYVQTVHWTVVGPE